LRLVHMAPGSAGETTLSISGRPFSKYGCVHGDF
jgi:hypothetical protein